jgi:hypothetical protein
MYWRSIEAGTWIAGTPVTRENRGNGGKGKRVDENRLFEDGMVDHPFLGDFPGLHLGASALEVKMLKYFMRYKPGWWLLHVLTVGFTLYLGHMVRFAF